MNKFNISGFSTIICNTCRWAGSVCYRYSFSCQQLPSLFCWVQSTPGRKKKWGGLELCGCQNNGDSQVCPEEVQERAVPCLWSDARGTWGWSWVSPELGDIATKWFILSLNTDFRSKAALPCVQWSLLQPLGVWQGRQGEQERPCASPGCCWCPQGSPWMGEEPFTGHVSVGGGDSGLFWDALAEAFSLPSITQLFTSDKK